MNDGTPKIGKPVVLVGLMGAGKTSIGRRLAARLNLPFKDADAEIEAAAGAAIPDIFERLGEPAFRDGERRVIARLLDGPVHILATGGGAFMDENTRLLVKSRAVSVWLKADLETLVQRTGRSNHRPLLRSGNPREILSRLMEQRYPVYSEADLVVQSDDRPAERTVDLVSAALAEFFTRQGASAKEVSV